MSYTFSVVGIGREQAADLAGDRLDEIVAADPLQAFGRDAAEIAAIMFSGVLKDVPDKPVVISMRSSSEGDVDGLTKISFSIDIAIEL